MLGCYDTVWLWRRRNFWLVHSWLQNRVSSFSAILLLAAHANYVVLWRRNISLVYYLFIYSNEIRRKQQTAFPDPHVEVLNTGILISVANTWKLDIPHWNLIVSNMGWRNLSHLLFVIFALADIVILSLTNLSITYLIIIIGLFISHFRIILTHLIIEFSFLRVICEIIVL